MKHKPSRLQRTAAVIGILLLLSMYAAALISAFIQSPAASSVLQASIVCTIVIPVFLYVFMMCTRCFRRKDTDNPEHASGEKTP